MKTETNRKQAARRGPPRFPTIGRDAALLGVSRTHLWRVLSGRRESRSLVRRYRELTSAKEG